MGPRTWLPKIQPSLPTDIIPISIITSFPTTHIFIIDEIKILTHDRPEYLVTPTPGTESADHEKMPFLLSERKICWRFFMRILVDEGLGGLKGNNPGVWLPITVQWWVTKPDWWQLIIRARPVTCNSTQRKEEGRKQEDPPVKTVKLGWSDRSLSTCCQISQSLDLH